MKKCKCQNRDSESSAAKNRPDSMGNGYMVHISAENKKKPIQEHIEGAPLTAKMTNPSKKDEKKTAKFRSQNENLI